MWWLKEQLKRRQVPELVQELLETMQDWLRPALEWFEKNSAGQKEEAEHGAATEPMTYLIVVPILVVVLLFNSFF